MIECPFEIVYRIIRVYYCQGGIELLFLGDDFSTFEFVPLELPFTEIYDYEEVIEEMGPEAIPLCSNTLEVPIPAGVIPKGIS